MIEIHSGKFITWPDHHKEWFLITRFTKAVEIWAGRRWIIISW